MNTWAPGDAVISHGCHSRDGRVHLIRRVRDLEPWLMSFKAGECLRPAFGLCGRCNNVHADRDVDGEVFGNCIRCQADLMEVAVDLHNEQEAE
ncbi:MAG TPA: hypothetical protein VEV82_03620 [Actinomycetota bacterium]|nr:hypothetical protein [Actinomycetota bacterium]